jgi:ligand-binding sensor domain-containing protein/two-component sensor histidine kinase
MSWKAIGFVCLFTVSVQPGVCASKALRQPVSFPWNQRGTSYGVDFWREAEGFIQSRVRAIAQTRDGYIWLGTDGGLVRFNGETFTAFTRETGELRDNEVWALREDEEGSLWIGTYGGGLTVLKQGIFHTITTADGLPDDVIIALDFDRQGDLWIVTPRGLVRRSHGVFERFATESGLPEARATSVCATSPEGVVVATPAGVLGMVNGKFTVVPLAPKKSTGVPQHVLCGSDGSLWVGLSSGLIERRQNGVWKVFYPPPNTGGQMNRLYEDPQGGIWAVWGKLIAKLQNDRFEPVPVEGGVAALGSVYTLFMDREGGVWVGLQSNGLARLRTRQMATITAEDGLPDNRTRTVFEDSQGDLWVGTAEGLARYHHQHFETWTSLNGAPLGDVRSIAEDSSGNIWLSSGKDLLRFKEGRLMAVPGWRGLCEIEVLYRDAQGRMWIGTDGAGLFQYSDGRFRNYRTEDGIASDHIRAILGDRSGTLWISTFGNGLSKYAGGTFTTLTTKNGLAGDRILAMHEDEEGALWFATRRGLCRLKDGHFFTWTSTSGLYTDFVYAIIDDGRGNFWFSSALGLFKVAKAELRGYADGTVKKIVSVTYGEKDGLRTKAGNVGNQPVAWKTRSGLMLFTSMKGLVAVEPDRIAVNNFVPPVYIEKALLNKREQPLRGSAQLPVGAGELEIHYAALDYSSPDKMRFKYTLEGFDQGWIDAGARRFTHYANLGPGKYRFRVIAGKADGSWNETGDSFSFYFKPPFYRSSLFAALAIPSVFLFAGFLYWLRMRGLKARYSAVLAERNRISQDIHDTLAQNLAGIALQLDAVHMQLPDVKSDLRKRLDEACDLTRYSLAEARRAITDLRSNELEYPDLSSALPEIVQRLAAATLEARVRVAGTPRKLNPTIERNLLRIVQEALSNAVKHAHARTVDVELTYTHDSVALRVRDDGDGFDPKKLWPAGSGHYGLIGMRERAERIGGHLMLNSRPGEGTELRVEVPIGAHAREEFEHYAK